ncbi:MAG: peptidylprolyl isomerase, partial [Chitinophagales bacterium]
LLERQGDRIHTRHILLKPVFSQEDMDKAASEIDSIRNLIVSDTLGFIKAVADFSDDEATAKTGGFLSNPQTGSVTFQLDQLDPNIYFAVESLQPEEVSEVKEYESSDGTKGFRIFYVYDRSEPHLASLETDFDKIQTVVKSQKTQQVMADWLDRKAPNTFVRIDDEFKSCPLIQNQWVKRYKAQ